MKSQALKQAIKKLDNDLKAGHDVVEVVPNTVSASTKKQVYQFGGSGSAVASQVSGFMSNFEMMQGLLGFDPPDFEKWCDEFENCFPKIPSKNPKLGDLAKPWGGESRERPKIKILNGQDRDPNRYVWAEFYPNRDDKDEVYLITGTPYMCVTQIMHIWNTKKLIEHGDFYQLLGYPPTQWLAKRPTLGVSVQFVLYNYPKPAFSRTRGEKRAYIDAQISIPFAKRSALTYEAIKAALGGSDGLAWGKYSYTAYVADDLANYPRNRKGMPQVWAKGTSYADAKSRLKLLLPFSEGKVVAMNESSQNKSENLNPTDSNNKSVQLYPWYMFVMNSRLLDFANQKGKETRLGNLDSKKNRLPLYHDVKPANFDERLDELFKWQE